MKPIADLPILILMVSTLLGCRTGSSSDEAVNMPSHPLQTEKDLDILLEKIGDSRLVLLGEASHGTAEYYAWRTALSKRLIREKGFTIIAVEGEWADSYRVNRFVKGPRRTAEETIDVLRNYDRWPTWMWGNYEVAALVSWLNQYNQDKTEKDMAGFFGLDVYCLWESMDELMPYIRDDKKLTQMALDVRKCFQPFSADAMDYAYAVARASANCRPQTEELHEEIMKRTGEKTATVEAEFVMQQNSLVAANAEDYYRTATRSYEGSWNVRDRHMMETIKRLLDFHGADSKIIIWEHNTHVGDARFTNMPDGGMVNVGQLVREEYGRENVFIVGFGSYKGTVTAAREWGGAIEAMRMPAAKKGSWEDLLHHAGTHDRILLSDELRKNKYYMKRWGHRAIGVQYHPESDHQQYVPTVVPDRYDAFIYLNETTALKHIPVKVKNEPPDLFPSGT